MNGGRGARKHQRQRNKHARSRTTDGSTAKRRRPTRTCSHDSQSSLRRSTLRTPYAVFLLVRSLFDKSYKLPYASVSIGTLTSQKALNSELITFTAPKPNTKNPFEHSRHRPPEIHQSIQIDDSDEHPAGTSFQRQLHTTIPRRRKSSSYERVLLITTFIFRRFHTGPASTLYFRRGSFPGVALACMIVGQRRQENREKN